MPGAYPAGDNGLASCLHRDRLSITYHRGDDDDYDGCYDGGDDVVTKTPTVSVAR